MPLPLEDYALIGDCQTAALIGRDGSIDWLCLPRFDSAACFAALLGTPQNGRWQIAPVNAIRKITRQYQGDTLVLETVFETDTGSVAIIDFMPIRDTAPDLMRIVEGREGTVQMRSELIVRYDYGSIVPWVLQEGDGFTAVAGPNSLHLRSPVENLGDNQAIISEFAVVAGERIPFSFTWHRSYDPDPRPINPEAALEDTLSWWAEWVSKCTYQGKWRSAVIRSLITLKAMTYMPSGGIVAAPTTSLPEHIGGVRNWDYRYCWLRDATLTLFALLNCGYVEEAKAWRTWLLRAVAGDPTRLQIMYGVGGERRLDEYEIPWLSGYEGSKPVRVGNAAHAQFQLDVYGEIADALHQSRVSGLKAAPSGWTLEKSLVQFVEHAWLEPDEGIWEVRGPRRHFTHSKVMAWVTLDRAIKSSERFKLDAPVEEWKLTRAKIHDRICEEGFNPKLNSFTQSFGSDLLDAALLMIPAVGFLPPRHPWVLGTVKAVEKYLLRDGLVERYDTEKSEDGLPPGEGVFLPCSFWLADCYALMGEQKKATDLFERLLALCNDVGLLSEEYDTIGRRMVGNFPQAFSHIGLVNTALALEHPGDNPVEQRISS